MDITSANSVFTLTPQVTGGSVVASLAALLPTLAGIGFQVQGFASDDAFSGDSVAIAETRKGVDGRFSAAFIPYITPQSVTLMADSPSIEIFDTIINLQKTLRQPIFFDGQILLASVGRSYAMLNGVLTNITPITPVKRVLESMVYQIHWDDVTSSPIA